MLDIAIGIGGLPRGRVVEVYGENSSGKTTLFTSVMASAQVEYPDEYVAFIDMEHAFDLKYAESLGLNTSEERLLFFQPNTAEEALDIAMGLLSTAACSVVVIDSVSALQTKAQLEKGIGEATMGQLPKLLSETLPKLTKMANRTSTLLCFVNQTREKVGVMYGNPTTTSGGKALPFYCSVRMEIRRVNVLLNGEEPYGQQVAIKIAKNKVGIPFKKIETNIIFGSGFDADLELVEVAVGSELITRRGAWYFLEREGFEAIRFQGKESIVTRVRDDIEFKTLLTSIVYPEKIVYDAYAAAPLSEDELLKELTKEGESGSDQAN